VRLNPAVLPSKTTSAVNCAGSAWSIQFQFVRACAPTPGATARNPCRWLVLRTLYFCLNAARRRHRGPPGQSRSLKPTESNWILDNYFDYRGGIKRRKTPTSASSTAKVALQQQTTSTRRDDEELSSTSNLLSSQLLIFLYPTPHVSTDSCRSAKGTPDVFLSAFFQTHH
jgi:hypothetical protein